MAAAKVTVTGAAEASRNFRVYAGHIDDTAALWEGLAGVFASVEADWFASEGAGSWPALSESWEAYKASHGYNAGILSMTGALEDSLTNQDQVILSQGGPYVEMGTDVEYAPVHALGLGVPVRDPIAPYAYFRAAMNEFFMEWYSYQRGRRG